MKPELHIVHDDEPEPVAEQTFHEKMLSVIVPTLADSEATTARLRQMLDIHRRGLATERGVAFIRDEQVRREFGQ